MIRIGYQGDVGSNSEQAAREMADRLGLTDVSWAPLVSAKNVADMLERGDIDCGVFAMKNNLCGEVAETAQALSGDLGEEDLQLMGSTVLEIHHCMFKKPGVSDDRLKSVASHVQALAQTKLTRAKLFPELEEIDAGDTALAAIRLANGLYPSSVAVICPKRAGLDNGLELMAQDIEDQPSRTEFHLYKLSPED